MAIGAASDKKGLAHYKLNEGQAFVAADVTDFLQELKAKYYPDSPFTVFWDNCKIHTTRAVYTFCEANDITLIANVPYRPDLNGIEHIWGWAKHRYRGMVNNFKARDIDWNQT